MTRAAADSAGFGVTYLPYIIFSAFAAVFFFVYLPQGFAPFDDGYLVGLGQRIVDGQDIYQDFYFLRTPLSPYVQAALIWLSAGAYTILWSKIYWAVQVSLTVVIVSLVYRRWLDPVALTVTLCASLVYSVLFFAFPWYTYDGMFFAALFTVFVMRRRFALAGVCAGCAFLAKQSFVVIGPVFIGVWALSEVISRRDVRAVWRGAGRLALGWAAPVAALAVYYLVDGRLGAAVENVFVLPARVADVSLSFALIQDLPEALKRTWPLSLALFGALVVRFRWWPGAVALAVVMWLSWDWYVAYKPELPFVITAVVFACGGWVIAGLTLRRRVGRSGASDSARVTFLALAIALTYASCLNYSGWVFSYIGGVIGIPAIAVASLSLGREREPAGLWERAVAVSDRARPLIFGGFALAAALVAHHEKPYFTESRAELTYAFTSERLRGVLGRPNQAGIDSLVAYLQENTELSERVFVFPDLTSANFLAGRAAWGPIHWYYSEEYDSALADETIELLRSDPPDVVALQRRSCFDTYERGKEFLYVNTPEAEAIVGAIWELFTTVDTVGPCYILRSAVDSSATGDDAGRRKD